MRSKKLLIFLGVFSIILFLGFTSARSCSFQTTCAPENTVLKLSSISNAHGEIYSESNYGQILCCDFTTADPHTCSGTNQILKLSSNTNAHAETSLGTSYGVDVCFADIDCVSESSCPSDKEALLKLSADTNAHLSGPAAVGDYPVLICCNLDTVVTTNCTFTSASWASTSVSEGTNVNLIVEGVGCGGLEVQFEVFENDLGADTPATTNPSNVNFNAEGTIATGSWIAEWIDDGALSGNPEYYFIATLTSDSSVTETSEDMEVIPDSGDSTGGGGSGGGSTGGGSGGDLIGGCVSMVSICSSYNTSSECVADACDFAKGDVEITSPLVDCDETGTDCKCVWNTMGGTCEPAYTAVSSEGVEIGTCTYEEASTDDCSDGLLSYSWVETWVWGHTGWANWTSGPSENVGDYVLEGSLYYYDPEDMKERCVAGSNTIPCPAEIALPFFGFYNLIISIAILMVIYFRIERKK